MTNSARPRAADVVSALGLLTRLPLPMQGQTRGAQAAWAWPLVGAVIGGLAGGIGALAMLLGTGPGISAGLALASLAVLTGALHEDGLADSADGLWGGWTPERRLEIMKDSHIGTYGVVALVLSLGLRWMAMAALFDAGIGWLALIAVATLSRMPMVALSRWLPNARAGGLSAQVGRAPQSAPWLALALGMGIGATCLGTASLAALAAVVLGAALCAVIALRKIGGQTGDILGATQQICEMGALVTLVAVLGQ
ncbi:adenosylcobinamide-GDP ribazoletransferase [Oceaniovalibus sp. ACAM 378]|uniref:adenosylcobinamide-GDP ribazoletransferase n=1 Tax=Oceaniovalibus sp. ACAM 378 TaxID=2599923 RepID=UPI0011D7F666|nr:adenosylcobinamide-GDP ribazoletransferase [Oceaniovalibus sp. ACAM 378]TYB88043.1 adenosylcobinamide-GDP ribazoletransferase [Oceaniovalibus sp. ACAM 378]